MPSTQPSASGRPSLGVSVVIPTYNRAYIIREAVQSALAQTHANFEILVVDDGSSDNTQEIVESFHSEKIRYIRHDRNLGCSAAYNTGIKNAREELVAFLDSDDAWKPDFLESLLDLMSRHAEVDVVFSDTEIEDPTGSTYTLMSLMRAFPELVKKNSSKGDHIVSSREMYLCLLEEVPIKPTAAIVKRKMFDRAGMFDEAWPSGTDWDLFLRISRVATFGYVDRPLVFQTRTADATHQKFLVKDKLFLIGLFLREKAALANDRDALARINRGIGGFYNSLAWNYLGNGLHRQALATYWQGFKETLQPRLLRKLGTAIMLTILASTKRFKRSATVMPLQKGAIEASAGVAGGRKGQ
jgi:glycosyltransferase involved in cell wall biosynthesis